MGSVLALQKEGRDADAATLARSLYEHAVHFAWLAADPSLERIEEWRKEDLTARLKADADMRRHGHQIFTDERREEFLAKVATMVGNPFTLRLWQLQPTNTGARSFPTSSPRPQSSRSEGSTRCSFVTTAASRTRLRWDCTA